MKRLNVSQLRKLVEKETSKLVKESKGFYTRKSLILNRTITELDKTIKLLYMLSDLESANTMGEEDADVMSAIHDAEDLKEFLTNLTIAVDTMAGEEAL
jgi:endonuclease III-like uncharacterized protein